MPGTVVLGLLNTVLEVQKEIVAESNHVDIEIPPSQPQVRFVKGSGQQVSHSMTDKRLYSRSRTYYRQKRLYVILTICYLIGNIFIYLYIT